MLEFREFLDGLGVQTKLDAAEATASGGCTLEFDGNLQITFELAPDGRAVQVYGTVMNIAPGAGRESVLATVLQLHLFGLATQDCYFGLDPQQDRMIIFKTIDLNLHDQKSALQAVENLVNQADRWRGALLDLTRKAGPANPLGPQAMFQTA